MNNVAPMTKAPKFSFSTEDNSFQGNTGCNSVFGNFSTEDQELNLSQLAVSEMYCPEEGVMETEREFLDILHNIGSYEIKDNTLIFYSKEDKIILLEASVGITR